MVEHELGPEEWQRISRILDLILDAPANEREALLTRECAGDDKLKSRVQRMLESTDSNFLEESAQEVAAHLIDSSLTEDGQAWKDKRIGPYRVKELLGAGGMGMVYLAERDDDQFHQTVALKLIRTGVADPVALQRFNIERQILADLDHPNMARLLDGGVTDDGSPYIVMEYVAGIPITEYVQQHNLELHARLNLFTTVCAVVEHAHRNLVVHRDLKPGNIYVAEDGTVKLLDFGIAKLVDPDRASLSSGLTQTDSSPLTPEYSSPEQLRVQPITTASDVYSLGVLLYEMLTGKRPYRLGGLSAAERERIVCEQMPKPPSENADSPGLARTLRGDLDHIVMMALRKEPERRYASAHDLAEDIKRYVRQEPVVATPDSTRYRMGKFVRRNKTGVAAGALVVIALIIGIGATAWQARIASRQRDLAQEESRRRQGVSEALIDILSLAKPGESGVDPDAASQVLTFALERAESEFQDDPKLLASLVMYVGIGYGNLGMIKPARDVLERADTLAIVAFGPVSREVAEVKQHLAYAYSHLGDYRSAGELHVASLNIRKQLLPKDHPVLAGNYDALSDILRRADDFDSAIVLLQKALDIRLAAYGENHDATAISYNNLANNLQALGRRDEAERYFRRAIDIWEELYGAHPSPAAAYGNLGLLLLQEGELESAEQALRKSIQMRTELKMTGTGLPNDLNSLGTILIESGDVEEAEHMIRQALSLNIANQGELGLQTGASHLSLSRALVAQGKLAEAQLHANEGYQIFRTIFGEAPAITSAALAYVGDVQRRSGLVDEGRKALRQALDGLEAAGLPFARYATLAAMWLGETHMDEGEFATAEQYFRESLEHLEKKNYGDTYKAAVVESNLGACLYHQGRLDEAGEVLNRAQSQLETILGTGDIRTVLATSRLDSLRQLRQR